MKISQLLVLVLLGAIWGASFIFMRVAAPEFGPMPLIGIRIGGAALVLLVIMYFRNTLAELRGNWQLLFLTGLTNAAIPFSLFAYATTLLSAGYTAVLNSLTPMFTALLGYLWLKQKLSIWASLGLLLGLFGVALLVQDKTNLVTSMQWYGVAAGIMASASYGFAANYAKQYNKNLSPMAFAGGHLIAATVLILPFALYWWPQQNPSSSAWVSALLLASLCTAFAHLLFFWLLGNVSAHATVSVTFMIPMFGMLWGFLWLDEPITLFMLLGCGIILLGVALTTGLLGAKAKKSHE